MRLPMIHDANALEALVRELGFLPLFRSEVPGFSVEDATPRERWFQKDVEGPWEWREVLADTGAIAYAKLFQRKAGFISPEYYPHFTNHRRRGMDFHTGYAAGLIPNNEKRVLEALEKQGPQLSHALKAGCGLEKGFDTAITSLQMRTYVTIRRLEYKRDTFGRPYGWGVSRYALSDDVFGGDHISAQYHEPPEASLRRLHERVASLFPEATDRQITRLLR